MKKTARDQTAYLSNEGRYTLFEFRGERLKIIAPLPLEHYVRVVGWKNGLITVMTKYSYSDTAVEEYIDLNSTLKSLKYDVEMFLQPIKSVVVSNSIEP